MQHAGLLQDNSLAVTLRHFDEGVNSHFEDYHNEEIVKYRKARDDILRGLPSSQDEEYKNVRLQSRLLSSQ